MNISDQCPVSCMARTIATNYFHVPPFPFVRQQPLHLHIPRHQSAPQTPFLLDIMHAQPVAGMTAPLTHPSE
ncbi:hypothetical protein GHT06_017277 [Daphnia sinensis]|uniref:Uncharacterized protein n=1 Tax=Daphnia sinensis TaxID=1820382 RepID=A0AAD5KPN5_9CRUS|nr:hypothetical protein GHT06_017277 [Daphnia sinensis]